jgi:hypothetical protein
MKNQVVFLLFVLAITTLAVVHSTALMFSLYWVYLWLDIPMHILGGAVVALWYQSRFLIRKFEHRLSFGFLPTIAFALAVGGAWEVYEYMVDPILTEFGIDTVIDLIMDTVGAIIGYGVARSVQRLDS